MVSGLCFVAPALPSSSSNSNRNGKSKESDKKDSFIWRASFGQQLQRLYMRALLQNENAGVNYIRRSLQKRRDEVALGKLQVYADAGQQVQQVSVCLWDRPCFVVIMLGRHFYIAPMMHFSTASCSSGAEPHTQPMPAALMLQNFTAFVY